jgi:hypothetical protein
MLIYLLVLTAGALIIASTLYWLARPTVYPNPGLSAYRPPTPDPIVARAAKPMPDTDQAAIQTAREENELLGWSPEGIPLLASDTPAPDRGVKVVAQKAQKNRPRIARRVQGRWEARQLREAQRARWGARRSWAFQNSD